MSKADRLVEVYRAATVAEAEVIRSLLDSYQIPCILKTNAPPSVLMGDFGSSAGVKVFCTASLAERAKELLEQKDTGAEPIGPEDTES